MLNVRTLETLGDEGTALLQEGNALTQST